MSDRLQLVPITIGDAKEFVRQHHRHHRPSVSGLFAVACGLGDEVVGVAIIGRPVARRLQDGWTAEVTGLATNGTRNACSILYAAAWPPDGRVSVLRTAVRGLGITGRELTGTRHRRNSDGK